MVGNTSYDRDQLLLSYIASKAGAVPAKRSAFRYISLQNEQAWTYLSETVLESKLPLTTPTSFNDPFDSNPVFINDLDADDLDRLFSDFKIKTRSGHDTSFNTKTLEVVGPDGVILSRNEIEARTIKIIREVAIKKQQEARLASFSKRISSQLLWAHYGAGHKGLAYHFIMSGKPDSILYKLEPVQYVTQRPIVALSEFLSLAEMLKRPRSTPIPPSIFTFHESLNERLFLHKSTEWAYEQEERIVANNTQSENFRDEELASLILGPLFPNDQLDRLNAIVSKRRRPLRIYRSSASSSDYSLNVDWAASII